MYLTFKRILAILFLMVSASLSAQTIVYVNATATGLNNGSSWTNAYTQLVDAAAAAPANAEIWIAQTSNEGYSVTKNNVRTEHIEITKPLTFVGGFMGTEISKSEIVTGQNTIISGEIGDNTLLTDNSNTAFQIKNTLVVFQGILFRKFYAKYADNGSIEYGAILADTNAIVDINSSSFMQNNGNPNGTCISAFKGSRVTISKSNIVDNVQEGNGSLICRNDDAVIRVTDVIFSNNGNTNASYVFYSGKASNINTSLHEEVLLDLNRVTFNGNIMPISYSYFGSGNFNNCAFNISVTTQNIFNHTGDSASFYMDSCSFNGMYTAELFGISGVKDFILTNSHILNPQLSKLKFFNVNSSNKISISNTTISNLRGSIPIDIYSPKGEVDLDNFYISDSDVSSYLLSVRTNVLNCNNLKLINCKAILGNNYSCNQANFNNCLINGFQGGDVLNCNQIPVVNFDKCIFKNIQQSETLFRSNINSAISVTNCSISGTTMTINNPGKAILFSVWGGQTLYAANNTIGNIFTYGNLVDNAGDMFIANCEFDTLSIQNSKSIFNNNKKLWVYNCNINANYTIPFLNDTSYFGSVDIDFNLVNSIIYTQQDTIVKNKIKSGNSPFFITNNISNKKISGMNSVSECTIPYANLYGDAYSIMYNKGFTPSNISQYPLVDLFGKPRIINGIVDIGVKEYQITTAIFSGSTSNTISIYPNPTQRFVYIKSADVGSMRITDCNGRVYLNEAVQVGENVFDIYALPADMYFVSVTVNDTTMVNKLVVMK
jgi:hypothetical protein